MPQSTKSTKIIAIGASTGGVDALDVILAGFSADSPPVVVVIHMPDGFTKMLAERLKRKLKVAVKEARSGDVLVGGSVFIAPSGKHMRVLKSSGRGQVECFIGEPVQYSMPSADVLFDSVADAYGADAVGTILTGMGADGAAGLLKMRQKGAVTIGQDRQTSAVYGMPKVAMEIGAVEHQLPLNRISEKILSVM